MAYFCYRCGTEIDANLAKRLGHREDCPKCRTDLHVCKACTHYDPRAYNECRESQADRVVDKEKRNYCDYFAFADKASANAPASDPAASARKKLDDLFK